MPRILIVHNIAWSHYKAVVFSELNRILKANEMELLVIHVALTENNRRGMGGFDRRIHDYPFMILFDVTFNETTVVGRVLGLLRVIREFKPDIVVLPGYSDASYLFSLLFSKLRKSKVIIAVDSNYFDRPRKWYKELFKKFFVSLCNVGFCYGTKSMEYLMRLGMEKENIFVRCQATDFVTIQKTHAAARKNREVTIRDLGLKSHNFIYAGRLSPEKNLDCLIEAFRDMKNELEGASDWGLLVVGDGDEVTRLKNKVRALKIADLVFFSGKSWREVPAYYALSDVLVLPSIREPWGLVVNEAMTCGMPVIVSNRCGSAFDLVVEGKNGYSFDPYDRIDLTKKMARFVNNDLDREKMGRVSRRIIEDYRPESAAWQMMQGIRRCLEPVLK